MWNDGLRVAAGDRLRKDILPSRVAREEKYFPKTWAQKLRKEFLSCNLTIDEFAREHGRNPDQMLRILEKWK